MAFDKLRNRMDHAEAALAAILETVNATEDVLVTRSTPTTLQSHCQVKSAVNNSIQSRPVADIVAGNSDTAFSGNPRQNNVGKSIVPNYNWASYFFPSSVIQPLRYLAGNVGCNDDYEMSDSQ